MCVTGGLGGAVHMLPLQAKRRDPPHGLLIGISALHHVMYLLSPLLGTTPFLTPDMIVACLTASVFVCGLTKVLRAEVGET